MVNNTSCSFRGGFLVPISRGSQQPITSGDPVSFWLPWVKACTCTCTHTHTIENEINLLKNPFQRHFTGPHLVNGTQMHKRDNKPQSNVSHVSLPSCLIVFISLGHQELRITTQTVVPSQMESLLLQKLPRGHMGINCSRGIEVGRPH